MEEANGEAADALRLGDVAQLGEEPLAIRRLDHLTGRRDPLFDREPERAFADGLGESELEIGQVVAVLASDLEDVAEARRVQQDEIVPLPLKHRVGDDRGRMQEDIGIRERSAGARRQLPNSLEDRGPVRRRQHLLGEDEPAFAILQHEIREGPADVDGDGESLQLCRRLDFFRRR
jgi:hypothetical protein